MKTINLTKIFILTILLSYIGISVGHSAAYIQPGANNSTNTRGGCTYQLKGTLWAVQFWTILTPAAVFDANWSPCASCTTSDILRVKWKNVKENAYPSSVTAWFYNGSAWIDLNAFTLYMPTTSFTVGTSLNIPCYITNATTISLNPYTNTGPASVGIDENEVITDDFEWTLPTGWQTTTGQTGTFVSTSSINVIPPSSSSSASISVRAKANLQYSSPTTLQITRNLNDFVISSSLPSPVLCNTNLRITAPAASGVSYSWQLPTGWTGTITTNYIDVIAKGASGNISCTMTGCNGSKTSSPLPVTVNIINPATTISGPSLVCSSGATFTLSSLPPGCTVLWDPGDLVEVSGQGTTTYRVKASGGNPPAMAMGSMATNTTEEEPGSSTTIKATISNSCGSMCLPLMQKTVWEGFPGFRPVVTGPTSINCGVPHWYFEQNGQAIYWSVPSSMQIIGPAGPGYRCTVKGLEFAAAGVVGTVSNGCGSFTDILEVDIECSTFSFFPNPASTSIDVTITDGATNTASVLSNTSAPLDDVKTYAVRITNTFGVPFYTTQKTGNCFTLPVDKLKDGIYILQVIDGINKYNKQLVVKH